MIKIIAREKDYLSFFKVRSAAVKSLSRYRKHFPLYASPELAAIVADVTGDGHLMRGLVQFISKDKNCVENFRIRVEKLFKVEGYLRRSNSTDTWECLFGGNFLPRILELAGTPSGNKTKVKFLIPNWILNGDRKIKSAYIRNLFDCEGSVILQRNRRIRIKMHMKKELGGFENLVLYFNQIQSLLKQFDIKTTSICQSTKLCKYKTGRVTRSAEFEIQGTRKNMKSILNYQSKIGFNLPYKKERLKNYLSYLIDAPVMPR